MRQANSIKGLADIALARAQYKSASMHYEKALGLYHQAGRVVGEATCIKGFGDIASAEGDHEVAQQRYLQALPLFRQVGSAAGEANCVMRLGDIAFANSNRDLARSRYFEALVLFERIPEPVAIGRVHESLAQLSESGDERRLHVREASRSWASIGRFDLTARLEVEFGLSEE